MIVPPQNSLDMVPLLAYTPDQLLPYVRSVSPMQSSILDQYVLHTHADHAVLVGYNVQCMHSTENLDACIAHVLDKQKPQRITVLAPIRPYAAPARAVSLYDAYHIAALPFALNKHQNVRHMCHRAQEYMDIHEQQGAKAWTGAHQELMLSYIRKNGVSKEMGNIFQNLGLYCKNAPHVQMFSAYDKCTRDLLAFSLADFTSQHMAFYMFSMRRQTSPPGSSELLLWALLQQAHTRGYGACNLGLGISDGIRFFKNKWGAKPTLPFVQTSWNTTENDYTPAVQGQQATAKRTGFWHDLFFWR